VAPAKAVWTISANEDEETGGDDLVNEDDLLEEDDLKKPDLSQGLLFPSPSLLLVCFLSLSVSHT